jgi:hypothetical protein
MAPGRPAAPKSPTRYLNSKRRVIYHVSGSNKYVAKSEKGSLVYNPKVRYVKSPGGTERLLSNTKARPPRAIRPKEGRRVRSNRGGKRAPYAGVRAGALASLFGTPKSPKKRGRPAKVRSPGPGPVARRYAQTLARKRRLAEKRAFSPMMGTKLTKMLRM